MKINNNKRVKTMERYASKWDNPNYRAAIDRNIKENARKTRERNFLANERNNKAILIIREMIINWQLPNKNAELENKIFVNKFYYNCAFDLESNFRKYGQLSEKMQSKPIGIIGNRQEFNLTILRVKESDLQVSYNNYVTSFKHDLIDADKNLFTMYSSKNYLEENNNNNQINISAIVKAHKTFNNVNYTHIKCPKIIK